ncbi:unnamed protein product [Bemisia tabaci]|uniref:hydroxyacylglutathione hydrolase n=1 Tax=Bemisia tabaci TaxID=7038 RepID=A0A9N9ZZQ8_BEMTA|nr:unnamed protein product [Bemisia tabaci]
MHAVMRSLFAPGVVRKGIKIYGSSHSFHSIIENVSLTKMQVVVLPALEDNYMYLISDDNTKSAAVIDPVSPDLVLEEVNKRGLSLQSILTTHHHWDHDGGNEKLTQVLDKLTVYGGDPRIKCVNKIIKDGDVFEIGTLKVKCMFTPCHTSGHMCYLVSSDSKPSALFSGDTLFVGGCGRLFEGTAEQMYAALCEVLASLPDDTKVFCGHEYTISNLKFAQKVDPLNQDVMKKLEWAEERRKNHQPTVPSTIGDEKRTNPFMRVGVSSILKCTDSSKREAAITVLGGLRKEKDSFQG